MGDVIQLRLGGVTGDARFFLISDAQRRGLKLPTTACRPVVSRARHLSAGTIGRCDWMRLRANDERVWLFDPPASQLKQHGVGAYLGLSPEEGGCDRSALKVRSRDPWHRTPMPARIDGFMSGMSGWGPWVVFSEMPGLAATNTLYIVEFLTTVDPDERAAWAMWLLTSKASRHLRRIGRRYADGLVKFEPGDLADLPIETPTQTANAYAAYKRAVRCLLQGERQASRWEADRWFSKMAATG